MMNKCNIVLIDVKLKSIAVALFLFIWIVIFVKVIAFSALTLLVGWQEGIWPIKNWWGAGVVI